VTFAYALHHKMGGVYRPPGVTYCDRYLDREERYELARLRESGHDAATVADAIIDHMTVLPPWFARTLTRDRGTELARHQRVTAATGIQVYFADPHAPWQRGSNENVNGLLREYLPKGTDLRPYSPSQLQAIAAELNDRPRKRLGYRTPAEEFARLLAEDQRVATTP
jgi:transposase, IS30 family